MTTTIDELITSVESELNTLINSGSINAKNVWFGDIDTISIQFPTVYFILDSRDLSDSQVIQDANRITWNLNYNVYCLHSGIEGRQKFTNARKFVDSVYNLLQTQHAAGERLNGNCWDIGCISVDYGYVSLDVPKNDTMTGGVIRLVVQVIEIF